MKKSINVLSLFDGMSCGQIALSKAKKNVNKYFASEVDKYAIKVTQINYPETVQLGDINFVTKEMINCKIDLIIGGSPCQDLSGLKEGAGLKGEKSRLFFEFLRLYETLKKTNPEIKFLLENVVPRKKEWKQEIDLLMNTGGVYINSDLFVQQNRPRFYWTNISIPELPKRPDWDGCFFQFRRTYFRKNKSGVCPCFTANMGTGGHNVPLKSEDKKDKLSPQEVEQLQGVPQNYTNHVSNSQRYKMLGNGWTVDVISHIFKNL